MPINVLHPKVFSPDPKVWLRPDPVQDLYTTLSQKQGLQNQYFFETLRYVLSFPIKFGAKLNFTLNSFPSKKACFFTCDNRLQFSSKAAPVTLLTTYYRVF
jgi:hypothetical protein